MKKLIIFLMALLTSQIGFTQEAATPPNVKVGAYFFGAWYPNSNHTNGWSNLRTKFPERESVWGWDNCSNTTQMSEQIDAAVHAGLKFFAFDWYKNTGAASPETNRNNNALDYFRQINNGRMEHCILVVGDSPGGSYAITPADWNTCKTFWISEMKRSDYLKVDGKPLLMIFAGLDLMKSLEIISPSATAVTKEQGELFKTKYLDPLRQEMGGNIVVSAGALDMLQAFYCGFDISTGYSYAGKALQLAGSPASATPPVAVDSKFLIDADTYMSNYFVKWNAVVPGMKHIPLCTLGWDQRSFTAANPTVINNPYFASFNVNHIQASVQNMVKWLLDNDGKSYATKDKVGILYAWNEYNEGSWLTPSKDGSFYPLEGVRKVLVGDNNTPKIGAYFFGPWYVGSNHTNAWSSLRTAFPERESVWGWDNCSNSTQISGQIDAATDAGLKFFVFDWYRNSGTASPESNRNNDALGYFRQVNNGRMEYCILVVNDPIGGSYAITPTDWNTSRTYWLNEIKQPNYLKIDGKPLLMFYEAINLMKTLNIIPATATTISPAQAQIFKTNYMDPLRQAAGGNIIISAGNMDMLQAYNCGFDISTNYEYHYESFKQAAAAGVPGVTPPFNKAVAINDNKYLRLADSCINDYFVKWNASVPNMKYIPVASLNWDKRSVISSPLSEPYYTDYTANSLQASVKNMLSWIQDNTGKSYATKEKIGIIYAWNDYNNGAWLTPPKNSSAFNPANALKQVLKGGYINLRAATAIEPLLITRNKSGITVYPNPVESGQKVKIQVNDPSVKKVSCQLYDVTGKLIQTSSITPAANDIAVPAKKGMYIVKMITDANRVETVKILVE